MQATGASPTTTVVTADSAGNTQTLNLSGIATVANAFNASNSATASGSGPTILVGGDNASLIGMASGDIFVDLGSGGSATTGANAQVVDFGSTFTINNQGGECTDHIHCNGVVVNGSDEVVTEDSGSSETVNGNTNTITAAGTATVDSIGNNDTITGGIDDTITDDGTNNTATLGAGSTIDETSTNSTLFVNGGSVTVTAVAGDAITQNGNGDVDNLPNGGSVTETGANDAFEVCGNNLAVSGVAGDSWTTWTGQNVTGSEMSATLDNTNGSSVLYQWDWNNLHPWSEYASTYSGLNATGALEQQVANYDNGSSVLYAYGSSSTDPENSASSGTGDSSGLSGILAGTNGGVLALLSYTFFFGLASNVSSYSDIVAQTETVNGELGAASLAQSAWATAQEALAAPASPASAAPPSPIEGVMWNSPVVTWSFGTGAGSGYAAFSDPVQAQYQETIEQALQTWANATGLTFQEAPDSPVADIRIGLANFATQSSGVVGWSSISAQSVLLTPGQVIQLEDPAEDALLSGSGGALTYSGTGTTLYQAALHEIGHALGFGESADPNSAMFPVLGSSNTTIDSTDVTNAAIVYSTAAASLVQAMASFGGGSPAVATNIPVPPSGGELTIAAALHH